MRQGDLILRETGLEELYWIGLILATGLLWTKTEGLLGDQLRIALLAGLAAVMVIVKFTLLRTWHIRRVAWTLDRRQLTVGDKTVPLSAIAVAGLQPGRLNKNTLTLVIKADHTLRLSSLTRGKELEQSVQGIRDLGYALKDAVDELDKDG